MATPEVKLSQEKGIGTISFFHPSHNALPSELLDALVDCIAEASADEQIKVLLLQSRGDRTFCAGANFDELKQITDPESGEKFFMGFAKVMLAMRSCPKFIIGRVQGKAVGGGVGLAAATDYCFATKYAAIKLSELSLGIGPFVILEAVKRKIGIAALSELAIDASNFYAADWACTKGLYAKVYEDVQSMDLAVEDLLKKLSAYSPEAMKAMKRSLWHGTENWEKLVTDRAAISGKLVVSTFTKNKLAES